MALIIWQFKLNIFKLKSPTVKKSEIIDGYKQKIDTLNTKDEKLKYLKTINQELARNIFFDQSELQEAMKKLTAYSFK